MARDIIKGNEYLTLATVNTNGTPWVSILAYSYDKNCHFYYASIPSSKHGMNLVDNDEIACSIFDSRQDWGKGVGLQIEGVSEIISKSSFEKVANVYFNRKYPYGVVGPETAKYFRSELKNKNGKYKFYKITPKTIWMNNPYSKDDARVKINLNQVL